LAKMNQEAEQREAQQTPKPAPRPAYNLQDGIAVIDVKGPTTRYPSSYQRLIGGTSTMNVERAIDKAVRDPHVKGIMMHYETPGGTVAGQAELVDAIRKANEKKPVWSHGTDLVASAGMLYATQARRFSTNRTAELGSMGTRAVLYDKSGAAEKQGVKVIPIVAGKFKAAGLPGTEITPEQIEYFEDRIKAHNDRYIAEIAKARNVEPAILLKQEAKVFDPPKALELKLIDKVCSFEEAMGEFAQELRSTGSGTSNGPHNPPASRSRTMLTAAQLGLAKSIPGAETATEENADVVLLGAAQTLQTQLTNEKQAKQSLTDELTRVKSQLPKEPDLDNLNESADNAQAAVDLMLQSEQINPEQAKLLKNMVRPTSADGKPGMPNILMLAKTSDGKRVYQNVFEAFKLNKPAGVLKDISDAQPVKQPGQQADTLEAAANAVVGAHAKRYDSLNPHRKNGQHKEN
jgi:capsid assembly protease